MFHLKNIKMKKVLMICGAAMFGMATFVHAQDQDTASTDYNTQPPVEQQDQSTLPTEDQPTLDQPTQDPNLNQPTQDPTLDQPTHQPPVQDPALDRPTQDPALDQPTQDPALDQPTQDQPIDDGTNAIPQGQSRESDQPTQDQTDQSADPSTSTDPSMERPSEITPVEGKQGPNGEAVFMENGKYYYMDEAGEKKKIKKSELEDNTQ
jgi:hypothetical protein